MLWCPQAVSVCQTTIFSLILFIAYNSNSYGGDNGDDASPSFPNDTFSSMENETERVDPESYSFSSKLCPFGFIPLFVSNKSQMAKLKQMDDVSTEEFENSGEGDEIVLPFANLTMVNVTTFTKCVAPSEYIFAIVNLIIYTFVQLVCILCKKRKSIG